MWEDPIVRKVHETRARILARFNGDFHACVQYIQALGAEEIKRGVPFVHRSGLEAAPGGRPDAAGRDGENFWRGVAPP